MRVKNISARLHHVGDISIAPGEEKDIPKEFGMSINQNDLIEVKVSPAPKANTLKPAQATE